MFSGCNHLDLSLLLRHGFNITKLFFFITDAAAKKLACLSLTCFFKLIVCFRVRLQLAHHGIEYEKNI